ncbi:MAG: competence/damage-inducible protein A [Haloarculaceae archaeon]
MQVALLTIGDELLAGDTENTNATWLARRLTDRGVSVRRVLVVPDVEATIADRVRAYGEAYDAVIVTGGLGGTPDDVTMDAVARAFDRDLAENARARADVEQTLERISDDYPDINLDVSAEASIPEGARPLLNEEGLSPGCVVENVYVLPGIPLEMKAMFEQVADHFDGDVVSDSFRTPMTESDLKPTLEAAWDTLDAQVGCYPNQDGGYNRLKVTATSEADLTAAMDWLRERVEVGTRD